MTRRGELSGDEVHRIDKCLTGSRHELRDRALLHLGLGSGMRIGELVGLDIRDIAPQGRVQPRVVLEKHSTKSGKSRTVDLSEQAVSVLQVYLRHRFLPPAKPQGPLFPSQKSARRPMSKTQASLILKKAFAAAGVEGASSHSLRRTHANALRRRGVDMAIIQEQLGHASLAIRGLRF